MPGSGVKTSQNKSATEDYHDDLNDEVENQKSRWWNEVSEKSRWWDESSSPRESRELDDEDEDEDIDAGSLKEVKGKGPKIEHEKTGKDPSHSGAFKLSKQARSKLEKQSYSIPYCFNRVRSRVFICRIVLSEVIYSIRKRNLGYFIWAVNRAT